MKKHRIVIRMGAGRFTVEGAGVKVNMNGLDKEQTEDVIGVVSNYFFHG
jgi:hypothetical protein